MPANEMQACTTVRQIVINMGEFFKTALLLPGPCRFGAWSALAVGHAREALALRQSVPKEDCIK